MDIVENVVFPSDSNEGLEKSISDLVAFQGGGQRGVVNGVLGGVRGVEDVVVGFGAKGDAVPRISVMAGSISQLGTFRRRTKSRVTMMGAQWGSMWAQGSPGEVLPLLPHSSRMLIVSL